MCPAGSERQWESIENFAFERNPSANTIAHACLARGWADIDALSIRGALPQCGALSLGDDADRICDVARNVEGFRVARDREPRSPYVVVLASHSPFEPADDSLVL